MLIGTGFRRVAPYAFTKRFLNLHEYQAKRLMDKYGIATQTGTVACTPEQTSRGVAELQGKGIGTVVLKAQVFAGGRGKGTFSSGLKGGVQFVKCPKEAGNLAAKMIGHMLVTHQTGAEGLEVRKLLLTESVSIDKEFYLAMVLDRSKGGPVIIASREGGVDIEEVAERSPKAIHVVPVDILAGVQEAQVQAVVDALLPDAESSIPMSMKGLGNDRKQEAFQSLRRQCGELIKAMYEMFRNCDCSQIEINPLCITSDNRVLCVDAKLNFDDNAKFRQSEIFQDEDISLRDKRELEAEKMGMNYVAMTGNIGCLVNGAGLAMATMDLIANHGGEPANFLDLGGGATKEQVLKSFELLTSDPRVKAIFVNIFGGITRCDVVAQGILDAARDVGLKLPLVVRLVGNNAAKARELLDSNAFKEYDVNITFIDDFSEAAKTACALGKKYSQK